MARRLIQSLNGRTSAPRSAPRVRSNPQGGAESVPKPETASDREYDYPCGSGPPEPKQNGLPRPVASPAQERMLTILFVSPGEYISSVFGQDWALDVFTFEGGIKPDSCNIEYDKALLWPRKTEDYKADSGITAIGRGTSKILGEALAGKLAQKGLRIDRVFSGPELRCLQTASAIYDATGFGKLQTGVLVCNGYAGFYGERPVPLFLSQNFDKSKPLGPRPDDYIDNKATARMNLRYRNSTKNSLQTSRWAGRLPETYDDFRNRVHEASREVIFQLLAAKKQGVQNPVALVVVSGEVHIAAMATLRNQQSRLQKQDMLKYASELPHLATAQVESTSDKKLDWSIVQPMVTHLSYRGIKPLNTTVFKNPFAGNLTLESQEDAIL